MRLRKQKSRKDQLADLAVDYLKLKAVSKAVKGAGKTAKGAAVVVGAGTAAVVATKVVRGRHNAQAAT
ncbi:hypothetical protein [Solirubrobacter soli]|uniref:hypothetical protein n=1 Tax=Solirubrobacter soli TaxID=363832 RepID=UPI00041B99F0|nr:hypothetical protein [Solirubrobacter soli]